MKYSDTVYARALGEVLEKVSLGKIDTICKNFVQVIRKNGDFSRIDSIVLKVEEMLVKKNGGRMVSLEFARPAPKALVVKLRDIFSKNDKVEEIFNPSLVAGVRITIDGEKEFDNSLSKKLKKLFG
jgi:F0F1-type ATP synthase delta subunit